jgi:hypothetical protein
LGISIELDSCLELDPLSETSGAVEAPAFE